MSKARLSPTNPKIAAALTELQGYILIHFPGATFAVTREDDPAGVYLTATVDIDDPDEVMDVVGERLLALEVDEGLPNYVVPVRTPERVARYYRDRCSLP